MPRGLLYYTNYSGTGNTLNANLPIVRRMILDSLCYCQSHHFSWCGFRILASRDEGDIRSRILLNASG